MNGAGFMRPVGFVWGIWVRGGGNEDLVDVGESDV